MRRVLRGRGGLLRSGLVFGEMFFLDGSGILKLYIKYFMGAERFVYYFGCIVYSTVG